MKFTGIDYERMSHQTLLISAKALPPAPKFNSEYHTVKVNGILCVHTSLGDYLDIKNAQLTLPLVYHTELIKKNDICCTCANHTGTFSKGMQNTSYAPLNGRHWSFIPNAKMHVQQTLKDCSKCNGAKFRAYSTPTVHFTYLIRGQACTLFSWISIDVVPFQLAAPRQNSTRNWHVIAVLCMLSNCIEYLLANNMHEDTAILKLLLLQARYHPIQHIVTDMGSNWGNLEMTGVYEGEPLRVFSLLKRDICLFLNPRELGKKVRQGVIVSLGKTTIKVRFPNGHVNDFNGSQVIFISRPPLPS